MPERVKVEIYGQTYQLQASVSETYIKDLARFVDEKMRAVSEATQTVDSLRVAVLAALSIADELQSLRQGAEEREEALRERAERCLTLVERALKQSA